MKYRSRSEIMAMILDVVSSGATKSKILYRAYISYGQMKEYVSLMEGSGLITYEEGAQIYRITEKGLKLKQLFEDVSEMSPKTDQYMHPSLLI